MTGPAELEYSGFFDPETGDFTRSPDGAERNPGVAAPMSPDFASLHPGHEPS
jgi:hypothetical protein